MIDFYDRNYKTKDGKDVIFYKMWDTGKYPLHGAIKINDVYEITSWTKYGENISKRCYNLVSFDLFQIGEWYYLNHVEYPRIEVMILSTSAPGPYPLFCVDKKGGVLVGNKDGTNLHYTNIEIKSYFLKEFYLDKISIKDR